jgi:hypothetical protein
VPIQCRASGCSQELLELLLCQPGIAVDAHAVYQALLHEPSAISTGKQRKPCPLFDRLVTAGGSLQSVSAESGNTPLHFAAIAKDRTALLTIIVGLKRDSVDVNKPSASGLTALQLLVKHAKEGEGEPTQDDPHAPSPIQQAVNDLISAGANVNVTDSDGNTPLHIAGECLRVDAVVCMAR